MDASRLADHLSTVRGLLCRLPTDQPARLVVNDDGIMLLVDTADALQTLRAMFLAGTRAVQTRQGTWRVRWCGIVVLVQEPLPEPPPVAQEIKL